MKKNTLKIIFLIIINILFIFAFCNNSFATIIDPGFYEPESLIVSQNSDKIMDIGNSIIGVLQIVGSIISVIVLVILGIKYMVGSAEERAEYKKSMMPYLIGAVMVFAITNLLGIVSAIAKELIVL